MLRSVPEDERTGYVFNPKPARVRKHERATLDVATRTITKIGRKAGVVVARRPKLKHGSAHDLRRAFGNRWAKHVKPAVLKDLMRHSQIETTMKYYVNSSAEETADVLWKARPQDSQVDTLVDTAPKVTPREQEESPASPWLDGASEMGLDGLEPPTNGL